MKKETKKLFTASSIIAGTCIGAGFLGIPFVAAQAGFFTALGYLIIIGGIVLLVNLYLGEIMLRTKSSHQLTGYVEKYLGKKAKNIMLFATLFLIYSALIAYMLGVGNSLSFIFFNNLNKGVLIGGIFGLFMSGLILKGLNLEKIIEKTGIFMAFAILVLISFIFLKKVDLNNLYTFDIKNIFLPFGVILFSSMSFFALPEAKIVLGKDKKLLKKAIIIGTLLPLFFYLIFTFLVVGFMGEGTPQIATLALGNIFISLGIVTMITSYFALGVALKETFSFDLNYKKKSSWILAGILPILLFISVSLFQFFSFISILSVAGVVSGGTIGILILFTNRKAKKIGERIPEYHIKINRIIIGIISILLGLAIIQNLFF